MSEKNISDRFFNYDYNIYDCKPKDLPEQRLFKMIIARSIEDIKMSERIFNFDFFKFKYSPKGNYSLKNAETAIRYIFFPDCEISLKNHLEILYDYEKSLVLNNKIKEKCLNIIEKNECLLKLYKKIASESNTIRNK